jgi:hypothetical protein
MPRLPRRADIGIYCEVLSLACLCDNRIRAEELVRHALIYLVGDIVAGSLVAQLRKGWDPVSGKVEATVSQLLRETMSIPL